MRGDARRAAHRWVADVLVGALANGGGDETMDDPEIVAVIGELIGEHEKRGRQPAETDWSAYGRCTEPACNARPGRPCRNLRTHDRDATRPHPGRPYAEQGSGTTGSGPTTTRPSSSGGDPWAAVDAEAAGTPCRCTGQAYDPDRAGCPVHSITAPNLHPPTAYAAAIAEATAMEERDLTAGGHPWEVPDHPDHDLPGGWHHGQIR